MAKVTLPANGDSVEIVAALSVRAIVQNTGSGTIELLNHATLATDGILLEPGGTLDLGKVSAWTLQWVARSTNGKVTIVRVAQE
jgi:hypothetical protein